MATPAPASSLRERSKLRRRQAIQHAAMRLFAENGYDGTTIAEIAELAEVALRTVTTYFPTKLDLAVSFAGDFAARLSAAVQDRPDLPLSSVIDLWLQSEEQTIDPALAPMMSAMYEANPGLRAISGSQTVRATEIVGAALIKELGLPDDDPMIRIVGVMISAGVAEYLPAAVNPGADSAVLHQSFLRYIRAIVAVAQSD